MNLTVKLRRIREKLARWLLPSVRRLEKWSNRDQFLMDQWFAAVEHGNREEMDRLKAMIDRNWQEYRNTMIQP